jgi:hypothetical protein
VFGGYHPTRLTQNGDYVAQPTFYSMWMFSRLQGGRILRLSSSNLPKTTQLLAVTMPNGSRRVLLANLSQVPVATSIRLAGGGTAGEVLTLTAPSLSATAVSISGRQIPANGAGGFAPTGTRVMRTATGFPVAIPAASAVLLSVGP